MNNEPTALEIGSSPSRGTSFPAENGDSGHATKDSPNNLGHLDTENEQDVKFPKKLRYRGKGRALARIYKRPDGYRLYWRQRGTDGKARSFFRDYIRYGDARAEGDKKVAELAKGQGTALTPGQCRDATAALERLRGYYQATGRQVSLLSSVSEYCEAAAKLSGLSVNEAVDRFLATVATVKRKLLSDATAEFIESRKHLGESKNGDRPKRSPVYLYNTAMWLREFSATFPGHCVCDLTKEALNTYIGKFKELSAKSRNDRRAIVRMFLDWCVAKDYLTVSHRLLEAVDFKAEEADHREIDYYRPKELRDMLNNAEVELVPVLALGGLGGLRREEILRLDWSDLWRVKGKVEISSKIAKGRKRRLVSISPALAAWLRPYRRATGPVWSKSPDALEEALTALRDGLGIPARRNGLRHAYITFHMAMHTNENLTAAEAGNSPQMIHDAYRALATRREALKWFRVRPARNASTANILALPTPTEG